ncbi:uncharacterized protein HD556DRAFT_1275897 [Suillus plorans]|uniref:DUF6699 domain-containing protein n=1 Tax=Suillus plorans TaxID=116603 RepID=A0A9P7AG80_9AGAM|nr:uncharacterized protein HD556DRAFT_1275897 [Suillus plorans]KAG1788837.1 hypothetical protein HD556DRAFT_1275897 [Suillus plorans]
MHYRMGSSSSSHSHKSWGSTSDRSSWSASPAPPAPTPNTPYLHPVSLPIPSMNAPHLHTVSLPHPNAHLHQPPVPHQHSSTTHSSMIVLHPLLSRGPNIMFNVMLDLAYVQLRPDCPPTRIWEFALQPKVSRMTITIPELPAWIIEVVNPHGITVNDVLLKIRETLNQGVTSHEMQMHRPSHAVGAAIESFRARSRADQREHALGVKRFDFLGPKVFFVGLTRARDGSDSWNVHLSQNV